MGDGFRHIGATLETSDTQVRIWICGLTCDDGDWVDFPEGMPAELRVETASFDVTGITADGYSGPYDLGAGVYVSNTPECDPDNRTCAGDEFFEPACRAYDLCGQGLWG
jgi:hypothetical protein